MIESIIFWLRKIEKNQDKTITHWQIRVIFESFFSELENIRDEELKMLIFPFFAPLLDAKSHNHKALIAGFMLNLINDHLARKKEESEIDNIF